MKQAMLAALVLAASVAAAGCSTYLGHAKRAYGQGMYLEVAEGLGQHEEDLPILSPKEQLDYGTYRGLALKQLGDRANARRWLLYAQGVGRENPDVLLPEQGLVIDRALAELAGPPPRPAEAPPPALPPSDDASQAR